MAKKAQEKCEQATFDFSRVGRDWSNKFRESMNRGSRAAEALNRPLHPDADDDAVQAYYDRRDAALATLEALPDEQSALIALVLASVPRSWLMVDAPEIIDWTDPKSLDYLTPPGYGDLLGMIQNGEAMNGASQSAKN